MGWTYVISTAPNRQRTPPTVQNVAHGTSSTWKTSLSWLRHRASRVGEGPKNRAIAGPIMRSDRGESTIQYRPFRTPKVMKPPASPLMCVMTNRVRRRGAPCENYKVLQNYVVRVVPLLQFLNKQTNISNRNLKPSNQKLQKLPPSPLFWRFGLKFQDFGFKSSNRIAKPNSNAQTEPMKF
jgi:hypothetical protein